MQLPALMAYSAIGNPEPSKKLLFLGSLAAVFLPPVRNQITPCRVSCWRVLGPRPLFLWFDYDTSSRFSRTEWLKLAASKWFREGWEWLQLSSRRLVTKLSVSNVLYSQSFIHKRNEMASAFPCVLPSIHSKSGPATFSECASTTRPGFL